MAVNTTFLDNNVSQLLKAPVVITKKAALPASGISNGDNVQLFTVPIGVNYRLTGAVLRHDATLGAGATLQLQVNRGGTRTSLSAASTAGAASHASSAGQAAVPFDLVGGDIIEALVGGANISGAANLSVDLTVVRQ
jgi:hypothetical protein